MIMLNEVFTTDKIIVALIGIVAGIASATVSYLWQVRFEKKEKAFGDRDRAKTSF